MPKIEIFERDETLAGESASSTDVVFVPGFAATNTNCYVLTNYGDDPNNLGAPLPAALKKSLSASGKTRQSLPGTKYTKGSTIDDVLYDETTKMFNLPMFAINIADKKTWTCNGKALTETSWDKLNSYIAPHPENYPVLCTTVAEFESYFGKNPYRFTEDQVVGDMFADGAWPNDQSTLYKAGDYEKSYIYAKELLRLGIPVIYENLVCRENTAVSYFEYTITPKENSKFSIVSSPEVVNAYFDDEGAKKDDTFSFIYGQTRKTKEVPTDPDVYLTGWFLGDKGIDITESNYVEDISIILGENAISGLVAENDTFEIKVGDKVEISVPYAKAVPSVEYFYKNVSSCFTADDKLKDKGELTVKYITTGAYPVYELDTTPETDGGAGMLDITYYMIQCAEERGDAFAIIDAANNPARSLATAEDENSVYSHVKNADYLPSSNDYRSFATMFGPMWCSFTCTTMASTGKDQQILPPSFAYLISLANSIKTNPNWYAVAGVNRGVIPSLKGINSVNRLTNTLADAYQPRDGIALNAITNIKPYGQCIWGNRTLFDNATAGNLTARSFLNVRSMVCDIKKVAYTAAKSLIFEQNTEILWNKFKALVMPTLDRMVYGYGLTSYQIIKANKHINGDPLAKGQIAAIIRIYPIYALEDFEITVVMSDEGVTVE